MDGDLFGVAAPVSNNAGNTTVGSFSDEPSLLDFASPPPSQETTNTFDDFLPQQPEPPKQQTIENLLDFAQTTATQEPLEDLFGDSQISPNLTPTTTPQQPSQASEPLDLFGSPMPNATTPTPAQTATVDLFAPVVSPAPMAATTPILSTPEVDDDPFAAFLQPKATPPPSQQQHLQQPAKSDPFSALSGNLSMPTPPKPNTMPSTETGKVINTTESLLENPVSTTTRQTTTTTSAPQGPETTQIAKPVVQITEEEKKDQDSIMMTVELKNEEEMKVAEEQSIPTISVENGTTKEEKLLPAEASVAEVATEESNVNSTMSQKSEEESNSIDTTINKDKVEEKIDSHEPALPENVAQETPTAIPNKPPIITSTNSPKQQPKPQIQQQIQANPLKALPTLTKAPKLPEKKAPAVSNRFAGFKSMAGNIAAKGAERVAKVKDQIKEEGESSRFSGFKNMAESMAQKGAERVAKVKDQMQKEEGENATENTRFSGFKNMAESMAAKGAERVAKVKDQIQKEDADGQNVTAKRLSGFKNMAGNIAARASVQSSQQFNAANLSLFAKGNKAIENMTRNSNHGFKAIENMARNSNHGFKKASSSSTAGISNSKPALESAPKTVAKSQSDTNPSTTAVPQTPPVPVANDTQVLTPPTKANEAMADKVVEPEQPQANGPSTSEKDSTETTSSKNKGEEPVLTKASSANVAKDAAESIILQPQDNKATESVKSTMAAVETKTNATGGSNSDSAKNEMKSTQPIDSSKGVVSQSSDSKPVPKPKVENSVPATPVEASKELIKPQIPPKTKESVPSKEMIDQIEALKKELQAAQSQIKAMKRRKKEEKEESDTLMVELQANLQKEMTRRAEAEDKARVAVAKSKRIEEEYTTFKTQSISNLDGMTTSMESWKKEKEATEKELVEIREERDEQARNEMALTTRLNDAKKKEGAKANAAEHYGDKVDQLEQAVVEYETQVETLTAERDKLKVELGEWKEYSEKRTSKLEMALNNEKKLNDERKKKMKGFVEAKTEEVRAAKADYISLQTELDQTSHSLTELNQRYKQLHAQWVQSQTRNRELQRDAMKMKKDSEKMHKVGGSLEARLSRSAQQSEDHKNKRIEARNELMSVLGQLEAERTVNRRLQESIKMSFTPQALSQQQTVQEALDDFDAALQKLSIRIGRPLPPTFSSNDPNAFGDNPNGDGANETDNGDAIDNSKTASLSEINSNKAVQKLENETQRVSEKIVKFSASVEQMHSLLDGGGTKSCVDIFSQILTSGNSPAIAGAGGQRYGQISRNVA